MTYEEANDVKHLAQPCNEVLEKLEIECPECDGNKMVGVYIDDEKCPTCGGMGKVKYSWAPKVGEWYISPQNIIHIIPEHQELGEDYQKLCVPILDWEEIEGMLEEAGYYIQIIKPGSGGFLVEMWTNSSIEKGDHPFIWNVAAKSRQEAVMRAIIELGREL